VIDAIAPAPGDRFLEIGPGPGALTSRLAPRVARLTAIEVDRDLAARLRRTVPANTTIVQGDVLKQDLAHFAQDGPLRVAGNLPYNISSPILFQLLRAGRLGTILDATVMLQFEVAERLTARVGTHEYGVLTILTAMAADVDHLLTLPPGAFRPPPKVRSAVVRLTFRPPPVRIADETLFERLVRTMFMQRRKMVLNSLRPLADAVGRDPARLLADAAIDPRRRPETLQLTEVARLADVIRSAGDRAVL
jgi:16S rRNA (adenine1518-N6/adenine1519-N6)-dimethyltransferase